MGHEHHKESKNTKFRENLACSLEYYFVSTFDELQPSKMLAGRLATYKLAGFKLTNLLVRNVIDSKFITFRLSTHNSLAHKLQIVDLQLETR